MSEENNTSLLPLVVHLTQDVINQKSKDLNLLVAA